MFFPKDMIETRAWMVRKTGYKHPRSAFESRPIEYETPAGEEDHTATAWRLRWNVPEIWAKYNEAKSFVDGRPSEYEGLTFVVHHLGDMKRKTRWVCLDFDHCIDDNGELDGAVAELLELFETFIEYSRSRHGLHVWLRVENCPAFANLKGKPIGGCKLDVFCSNPVAVTGDVFGDPREVQTITFDQLEGLPFFVYKQPADFGTTCPEWWSEDPIDDVLPEHEFLIPQMELAEAIEGCGGQKVLYAAACELMREGVTGRAAEALLRMVPADPPFSAKELRRTLECAYRQVTDDGQFEENVFPLLQDPTKPENRYGFTFYTADELEELEMPIDWMVEGAFVMGQNLVIAGREKSFKTGTAFDLAVSLATGSPFLSRFAIPEKRRSVIFTAEIGYARAKHLLRSIRRSKGIVGSVPGLHVVDMVPSFGVDPKNQKQYLFPAQMAGLKLYFKEHRPEVAIFDPLYLAMGFGVSQADLNANGLILRGIDDVCKSFGITPVFCHHAKKDASKEFKPMQLGDISGAGVGAFARQWLLLAHKEEFYCGVANMFGVIGGSAQGSRGTWDITIDEGEADEIMERTWNVSIKDWIDEKNKKITETTILEHLKTLDGAVSADELFLDLGGKKPAIKRLLEGLAERGEVVRNGKDKFFLRVGK